MRHALATLAVFAVAVCFWAATRSSAQATAQPAPQAAVPAAAALGAQPVAAGNPADPAASSADAIRHAKRTACRKAARAKKLFGAEKTAYIKDCTAAP